MSAILTYYKDKIDKCWYDSTNVIYSECYDHENDYKDLKVVFKEGKTYVYKGVDVNDYILFKTDLSQGKALNKYIIKKYKGLRLPDMDMSLIEEDKQLLLEESRTSLAEGEIEKETFYHIKYDLNSNKIQLYCDNVKIFEGINNQINLYDVMKALGIKCSSENIEEEES